MPDTLPHLSKVSNKKLALKTLRVYFTPFLSILLSNLGKGYQLSFQAEIKGQTGKNYETRNDKYNLYAMLSKRVKRQREKKHESNLKTVKNLCFEQVSRKCIEIFIT